MLVDPVEIFERQFDHIENGFLYYPSPKSGGKLVSQEEYDALLRDWTSASKGKRFLLMLGAILGVIFAFVVLERSMPLPEWSQMVFLAILSLAVLSYLFWASLAPRRLVRGRPDYAPPRSDELNRQLAHEAVPWRLISFVLVMSGTIFATMLASKPSSLSDWLWTGGSAAFFVMYLLVGYRKWRGWG